MVGTNQLDCVVIGYNETPFNEYEALLRKFGEDSETYRDLKFSFVDAGGEKMTYMGLLNHAHFKAHQAHSDQGAGEAFKSGDIPNLAAVYLTNYLRRSGFSAGYVNLFQYEKEKLARYLNEPPLCVAITTTFYVLNLPVNEIIEYIRQINPGVKIIVGGPLVANHSRTYEEEAIAAALIDIGADIYVNEGQGESTLAQIVHCLKTGGELTEVPNLLLIEDGKLRRTAKAPENNCLDETYIDWREFAEEGLGPTIQTRTARSCAFNCSFCNYPTRAGKLTLASLGTIEKELDSMHALNSRNVVFIDDTFNVPLPRFKDICRLMIKKNYKFNWFSYFRCSNSDQEAVDLMAESGCKGVFLGIESGSAAILKNMNKAATPEKYADGISWLRERSILTFGSFIVGFPGETESTVNETVQFIRESKPDYYRAQLWYCEPGTPIDAQRIKYGIHGEGFIWQHATMDSLEAMDHIDRMFLTLTESTWLPQWSFDFWAIPYLIGKGVSLEQINEFAVEAGRLLALNIASVPAAQRKALQEESIQKLVESAKRWRLSQGPAGKASSVVM